MRDMRASFACSVWSGPLPDHDPTHRVIPGKAGTSVQDEQEETTGAAFAE